MVKNNSPFATFLIIGPTCFFLGMLFANFPYDYYVLWVTPPSASTLAKVSPDPNHYLNLLETHLKFIHASPPLINRILHIVIGTGLVGIIMKLYKPSEANMLFDGASLVLYMCGITVYIANIVKGLRLVSSESYTTGQRTIVPNESILADNGTGGTRSIGREDSLRVLAASNTILALVLTGVLILQAGQWYAMKKETAEIAEMDRVAEKRRERKGIGKSENLTKEKARSPVEEKKRL